MLSRPQRRSGKGRKPRLDNALLPLLLVSILAQACRSDLPELEVVYRGCARLVGPPEAPTCILRHGRQLDVSVISDHRADVRIELDPQGRVWQRSSGQSTGVGTLFRLRDLGAGTLRVTASGAEDVLALGEATISRPVEALEEQGAHLNQLNAEERLELEKKAQAYLEEAHGIERAILLELLGRTAFSRGDGAAGTSHWQAARKLFRQEDCLTDTYRNSVLAAQDAAEIVDLRSSTKHYESLYLGTFHLAREAFAKGRSASGFRRMQDALRLAERFQNPDDLVEVHQMHARFLETFGLFPEARKRFESLLRKDLHPCTRATLHHNLAWHDLFSWEQKRFSGFVPTDPSAAMVRQHLDKKLELGRPCLGMDWLSFQLDYALLSLYAGDREEVRRRLQDARRRLGTQPSDALPVERSWLLDLEARLEEPHGALAIYDQLASDGSFHATWRAAIGRAVAHYRLGQTAAAFEALEAADQALTDYLLTRPVDGGRHLAFEAGTRLHVEWLLASDRPRDAFRVARRSYARRTRALLFERQHAALQTLRQQSMELDRLRRQQGLSLRRRQLRDQEVERQRHQLLLALDTIWKPPADVMDRAATELSTGEVLLLFHPLSDGWAGFALEASGALRAHRLGEVDPNGDPEPLARVLLEPFGDLLVGAERLRLLPYGDLWGLDFQALPFTGGRLWDQTSVVYSLDLPAPQRDIESRRPADPWPKALIYQNPFLQYAERDAAAAADSLAQLDLRTSHQHRDTGALRQVWTWAHLATHARIAGPGGFDSSLELDRAWLPFSEIILYPPPRTVVLAACEGAGTEGRPQDLSVAKAFLLAGSRSVVALPRPIADRDAAELMTHFYRALEDVGPGAPAKALRRAQQDLGAGTDGRSFRVIVP